MSTMPNLPAPEPNATNAVSDPGLDIEEDSFPGQPESFPGQSVPGPIEDPDADWEEALKNRLITEGAGTIRIMVEAMESGMSPTRALYLIETYSAMIKSNLSELGAMDDGSLEDLDNGGGYAMYGGGLGMVDVAGGGRRGARAQRRQRRGGMRAFPVHGGPDGPARQMIGAVDDMADKMIAKMGAGRTGDDSARQIRDLTAALASARAISDSVLEAQIRKQLDALLQPPDVPAATLSAIVDAERVD